MGAATVPCTEPTNRTKDLRVKISVDADELSELEGLSDAELVAMVRDGFKQFRATARDANGNVASSKEIEPTDHTADDPAPTLGAARPPQRGGATVAKDAAIEHAIRQRAGADVEGEIALVRAERIDPAKVRAMDKSFRATGGSANERPPRLQRCAT